MVETLVVRVVVVSPTHRHPYCPLPELLGAFHCLWQELRLKVRLELKPYQGQELEPMVSEPLVRKGGWAPSWSAPAFVRERRLSYSSDSCRADSGP